MKSLFKLCISTMLITAWNAPVVSGQTPYQVKDIRTGINGGFEYQLSSGDFNSFTFDIVWEKNGEIFFVAISSSSVVSGEVKNNRELWKSDGTNAGTVMVKDIFPGTDGSYPRDFYAFNGELYFTADNGTSGRELWKTDGTNAGTVMVKDIRSGAIGGFESVDYTNSYNDISFSPVWVSNGEFYFVAINSSSVVSGVAKNNRELWKSNGTDAGTVMVKDIFPGTDGSYPYDFHAFGGLLYFTAETSNNGVELWKTDGTNAGTVMVKDIRSGSVGGFESVDYTNSFSRFNFDIVWENAGEFYFVAINSSSVVSGVAKNNQELWKSNGTDAGTVMVKDIFPGTDGSYPYYFHAFGGLLYFTAETSNNGIELWKTDGTNAGTSMVKDIRSGSVGGFESVDYTNSFSRISFEIVWENAGEFYFVAISSSSVVSGVAKNNRELWKSNGTDAGTVMVKDIFPGTDGSYPYYFHAFGGLLYFTAETSNNGIELWKTDGTNAGTVMVKDIRSGSIGGFESVDYTNSFNRIGFDIVWENAGEFYFVAISSSSVVSGIPKNNYELWKSNGTDAGTVMVKDIFPGTDGSYPANFYPFGNALYFGAENGLNGRELWKTDGTSAGTEMVKDIRTGSNGGFEYVNSSNEYYSFPFIPVGASNGEFYFMACSSSSVVSGIVNNNRELWKSNGTNAGTVLVMDICPGVTGSYPRDFHPAINKIFFAADNCSNGYELWAIDGVFTNITEPTQLPLSIFPNPANDEFSIKTSLINDEKIKMVIYDVNGREVLNKSIIDEITHIPCEFLDKGIYFVQLSTYDSVPVTKKLVVQ